ncbi:MAG: trimethylamine methyltransferase family protein [Rhizobiaceae bacterium]
MERSPDYRQLRNSFMPQRVVSDDEISSIHETAFQVLEDLGIKVLLPEARAYFASAGALVDDATQMVRIGRDIVQSALDSAPRRFVGKAGNLGRDLEFELGSMMFRRQRRSQCNGSGPGETRRVAGGLRRPDQDRPELRRAASARPHVEAQDIDLRLRHYAVGKVQLTMSDKMPFVYARGTGQVEESFEMIKLARGMDEAAFEADPHCYTVINTNSPGNSTFRWRRALSTSRDTGRFPSVTPFCLAGAMAPITVAGALTLQHVEALAGITLAQIVRRGAPVVYGSFSSNVDMKSGAPAFGTPEHVKATLGAGQLARHLGLPWRSGAGSASNVNDSQAAHETQFALWGSVLAGATICIHAAGWLEGGLSVSFEKIITDLEALQTFAELFTPTSGGAAEIGYDAIADVQPGGHFFSTPHTMERYRTAFYPPLVADLANFGNWSEAGAKTANQRANAI